MRCPRAQRWMTAAVDGELSPRRQRALDQHLAGCAACAREMAATAQLLTALAALPMETAVSARLEQATLRRVRGEAATESERKNMWGTLRGRWFGWAVPAFAAAAVLAIAVGSTLRSSRPAPRASGRDAPARVARETPSAHQTNPATSPRLMASAPRDGGEPAPGSRPERELAQAPDLFIDLPILRNMEKLQHFETIRTTTLDDDDVGAPGQEPQSNG